MADPSVLRLFAELRGHINGEDPLKTLEELQNRILNEEKIIERQKQVYEDEINILKENSNVSADDAKYRLIEAERELKNLKRENLEFKVEHDSVHRKNLELKEELDRLERRTIRIQEEAAKFRGQWVWSVEALKEERDALNRELSAVDGSLKSHVREWADTIAMMQDKSNADKSQIKERLFEGLYRFLTQQKSLIANEEKTLLDGLVNFIQNEIGGFSGTAQMLKERAHHMMPQSKKPNVADLIQLSPQQLRAELEFIVKVLNEKSDAIDRMNQGLQDFGTLSRHPELKPEKMDLADALEEWAADEAEFIGKNRIAIQKELKKTSPVIIDKNLLFMALKELALNAAESRGKNVTVQLQTETDPNQTWVGFSFEDNGPGIPAHVKEKIFLPFFTTKAGRLGLGLAKALRWISLTGGELMLAPASSGAKFLARFPVYESISLETP